jgi:hypothetical protein
LVLSTLTERNDIREDNRNQGKGSSAADALNGTTRNKHCEVVGDAADYGTNGKNTDA